MELGLALTRHCNLRCPHCIRDDLTEVRSLDPRLVASLLDQATELFDTVRVSFTGGEPLIHPRFDRVVEAVADRGIPYAMTTNGWHMARALPVLEERRPRKVHLSLSGATRESHDGERGRGSWDRVMTAMALLTSRRIPTCFSLIVDRRTRGQLRAAAELAGDLGAAGLQYILPQPVPGSAARDSDLPPGEWLPVRREVESLAREQGRSLELGLAYGAPFEGEEETCRTFRGERMYVDADGRLATCCQLSEYGGNEAEVVADLTEVGLAEARERQLQSLREQWRASRPAAGFDDDGLAAFPCLRCAKSCGKLDWLESFPDSSWHRPAAGAAAGAAGDALEAGKGAGPGTSEEAIRLPVSATSRMP